MLRADPPFSPAAAALIESCSDFGALSCRRPRLLQDQSFQSVTGWMKNDSWPIDRSGFAPGDINFHHIKIPRAVTADSVAAVGSVCRCKGMPSQHHRKSSNFTGREIYDWTLDWKRSEDRLLPNLTSPHALQVTDRHESSIVGKSKQTFPAITVQRIAKKRPETN